jgi:YjbE family integral membrane protein
MAVRSLPERQKRIAILSGGGAAIGLRMFLTAIVTFLTQVPLLKLGGGLVLIWITYRLLSPETGAHPQDDAGVTRSFWAAMRTIIIADVTMSTDNVLAVGAAAHGDVGLLVMGLALSMALLMIGGTLTASLMNRLPWLTYVGGLILLYLAGEMIATDPWVAPLIGHAAWVGWALSALFAVLVLGLLYRRHPALFRFPRVSPVPAAVEAPDQPEWATRQAEV